MKPVGWIATHRNSTRALHYAQSDGWQVEAVLFVDEQGMVKNEASAYERLMFALRHELVWWRQELANCNNMDAADRAKTRIEAIERALNGG
jgi:hypothetical protein